MKLTAGCPLGVDGVRRSIGDSFEATDYSGAKLIAQGAAQAASRSKAKAKKAEDKAED